MFGAYGVAMRKIGDETVSVGATALRVLATSAWADSDPTSESDRDRYILLSNHSLSLPLYYRTEDRTEVGNGHVTSSNGAYLGPGQATWVPVQKGHDLFVVRAAGTDLVYAWGVA